MLSRNNLPWIKDGANVINLDDKKVKKHVRFYYLLTEIQMHTLSFWDWAYCLRSIKKNQTQIYGTQHIYNTI